MCTVHGIISKGTFFLGMGWVWAFQSKYLKHELFRISKACGNLVRAREVGCPPHPTFLNFSLLDCSSSDGFDKETLKNTFASGDSCGESSREKVVNKSKKSFVKRKRKERVVVNNTSSSESFDEETIKKTVPSGDRCGESSQETAVKKSNKSTVKTSSSESFDQAMIKTTVPSGDSCGVSSQETAVKKSNKSTVKGKGRS